MAQTWWARKWNLNRDGILHPIQLVFDITGTNEDGEFALTDSTKILGDVDLDTRYCNKRVKDNVVLDNLLIFEFRDDFLNDGSKPNKCIFKITNRKAFHTWMGPLLVTKVKEFFQNFFSQPFFHKAICK